MKRRERVFNWTIDRLIALIDMIWRFLRRMRGKRV